MLNTAFPYRIVTPPASDPLFISIEDAKRYLRLTDADVTDADLEAFIEAAQAATERFTRLTLFTTVFETTRDFFQAEFLLKRAPLISVTKIERLVSDVLTTVDASTYKIIDNDVINYGSIVLKANQIWPCDQDAEARAITITFSAGFGVDSTFLPPDLIDGMKRVLSDLFENRGDCSCDSAGATASMSSAAKALLGRFKIMAV